MLQKTGQPRARAAWRDFGKLTERGETAAFDAAGAEALAGEGWRSFVAQVDQAELNVVRRLAATTRMPLLRALTLAVNLLGNGWLYPPLALAVLLSGAPHAPAALLCAALAAACAHALYALLKRRIARLRPFEKDRGLQPLARALDRYSFPSGHCMTLTAALIPLLRIMPALWPFAAAGLALLGWCRLASAHHYPSDVLAGIGIGAAVALPLSRWLQPL
jgi:undecaprenyl-diphosphatase